MSALTDAIADLKIEPDALDAIAEDYGMAPNFLRLCFQRAYGPLDTFAQRMRENQERADKAAAMIAVAEAAEAERDTQTRIAILEFFISQPALTASLPPAARRHIANI